MKLDEAAPYATLGICKVSDGYELRRVVISGMEVKSVKVLHKAESRAEIMQQTQIELSQYTIDFNQGEMRDKK